MTILLSKCWQVDLNYQRKYYKSDDFRISFPKIVKNEMDGQDIDRPYLDLSNLRC